MRTERMSEAFIGGATRLAFTNGSKRAEGDRRAAKRFPLNLEVRYKVWNQKFPRSGTGKTFNISSRGVLFSSTDIIPPGEEIEVSIGWPALLDGVRPLKLVIMGRTVRSDKSGTAIRTCAYEFRVLPVVRTAAAGSSSLRASSAL